MDAVWDRLDRVAQEPGGLHLARALDQAGEGELARAVDGHEQPQLPLFRADLGDVDMEVADRVGGEALLARPVTVDLGQPADAVPLEAAVQGRAGQMRDGGLEGVE